MNITITIDELDMGGAQHVVYEIVRHIDSSKYNLTIICTDGKTNSILEKEIIKEQEKGKCSIVFLTPPFFSQIKISSNIFNKIIRRLLRFPSDLFTIPFLCRELKKSKPDVIHAHQRGILAGYWALFNKIPMIATVHTHPSVTFYRECEKIIFRLLLKHKLIILTGISKYNKEIIKNYWRLNDRTVCFINNGINIENFYRKTHDTFTFINVSRQDKNKNQSLILRAFARLFHENKNSPIKLFLIGDGNTHQDLKKETGKLGISELVEFTGYIKDPNDYLAISDVYISSSHREGLSLSVLEAMASGLPVIATDAGGVRDLAQENGILIPVDDEDELFAAMKKLKSNNELRQFMGEKSLEMVQAFSAPDMAKKYAELYNKTQKE